MLIRMIATSAVLSLQLASAGCVAKPQETRACAFEYSKKFQTSTAIPALKREFGVLYKYFNYDDPVVLRKGNEVELTFGSFKNVDGRDLLYEGLFVMAVDSCTSKVMRAEVREGVR